MLEGTQEVLVQLHRLGIATGGLDALLGEPATLLDRVDQLAVPGGQLGAGNDEVPGLGQPRVVAVVAGQRAGADRVVAHEGRLQQRVLDQLLVQLEHHLAGVPAGLQRHPVLGGQRDDPLQRGAGVDRLADRLADQAVQGRRPPRLLEVDLSAPPVRDDGPAGATRRLEDQLAGEGRDGVVVAVRLVELEHRELRGVRGVHPLVAEDAADLEDPVDPADHQSLEVELQGDPQGHVQVERVEVRGERPRRRAAVHRLQHGRLHLDVAGVVQHVPHRAHDRRPVAHHPSALVVHDQVEVALPDPQLGVGQAGVLVRQGSQRLARHDPPGREHRQLTATAADDLTGDPDVVAEVDVGLPVSQPLGADAVQADHHLQQGVTLLQRCEAELPAVPGQHDATGHADDLAAGRVGLEVGVGLPDLRQGGRAGCAERVRRRARGQQPVVLLPTHPHLLRHAVGRG